MKINFFNESNESRLREISEELFSMYKYSKDNDAALDFYEKLREIWNALDDMLNEQFVLKEILPF